MSHPLLKSDLSKFILAATVSLLLVIGGGLYFKLRPVSNTDNQINPQVGNKIVTSPEKKEQSKVKIEVLKEGKGDQAENGDTLTVNYTGTLTNGTKFDSSLDRKKPFTFVLGSGQVIKGWDEGLLGTKVGEKCRLTIPPELAYGKQGAGNGCIPPNSTLIF